MKEYQIYYEYNDNITGLFKKVHCCTVYNDYNKAENELSDILSDLERKGCTNVAGNIIECNNGFEKQNYYCDDEENPCMDLTTWEVLDLAD